LFVVNFVVAPAACYTQQLTCDTQQQDDILDMLDKSHKSPNHFMSGMLTSSSNEKFQFQRIHPKFASHQRRQVQTPDKPITTCPKSNMDNFPGFQQNEAMLLNSRMATEQSHLKPKSKFESVSKIPQQERSITSLTNLTFDEVVLLKSLNLTLRPLVAVALVVIFHSVH
jgi:hypothetical protein